MLIINILLLIGKQVEISRGKVNGALRNASAPADQCLSIRFGKNRFDMSCETSEITTKWELYLNALASHFDKQSNDLLERRGISREDAQHNHRARRDRKSNKERRHHSTRHSNTHNNITNDIDISNDNNNNNNNNSGNIIINTDRNTLSATHRKDRKGVISPVGVGFDDSPNPMNQFGNGNDTNNINLNGIELDENGKRKAQHFRFQPEDDEKQE